MNSNPLDFIWSDLIGIFFQNDEVSDLANFKAPAQVVQVTLPGRVNRHGSYSVHSGNTLTWIEDVATLSHVAHDRVLDAPKRIDRRHIKVRVEGNP
jgi:hypothetical protein